MNGYTDSHASTSSSATYLAYMSRGWPRRLWEQVEAPLLRSLVSTLPRDSRTVLDLACGNGRGGSALVDLCPAVVGVDYSTAQMHTPLSAEMVFARGDATRLAFGDATFDVVVALRFFSNAEDALRTAALQEVRRVLKPGGLLVCNVHNVPRTAPNLVRQLIRWMRRRADPRWISRKAIEGQFRAAGLLVDRRISYGQIGGVSSARRWHMLMRPLMGHEMYVLTKAAEQ